MAFMDYGFIAIVLILAYWVFQLKTEMRRFSNQSDCKPEDPPSLTVKDMHMLQSSMAELVNEVEQFTDAQLRKMSAQTQTLHVLCKRLEDKLRQQEAVVEPPTPDFPQPSSTRVVPLSPKQNLSKHKDKDRIIDLYKKGWAAEQIAEELRITKGEVQLVVNLA